MEPIILTALGPNDPDDGDTGRQLRGHAIANLVNIVKNKLGYKVPSQSGNGSYIVNICEGYPACSCPDFELRQEPCKHIYAVEITIQREERSDGITIETQAMRVTYKQDWPAYNASQIYEGDHFKTLLRELCDTVPQPPQGMGRPRLPLSDMLFGAGLKVYSTMSGRRAMSDLRDAQSDGMMDKLPNFSTVLRYLEKPELTPILKALIEQSALPLRAVETDFAADSSGFSTSTYHRWFDHKWGKEIKEAQWVKAHIMCGVKTNIVTAVEVTPTQSADAPYMAPFIKTTSKNGFDVQEVSGDKAYLSRDNLWAAHEVNATAYIPFKSNSVGHRKGHHKQDPLWTQMFHYFNFRRSEFLAHYHKRSNVETTFSMIKAKFGASVRAKTPTAQVNETLVKILCHNIVVLISAIYELGITPVFNQEVPVALAA